ncbi:MAG: YdiU family protein [Betaproteobacteria bacterium]|nr:MAG: YdiU family protein [Betaproteobacteria bacterium]
MNTARAELGASKLEELRFDNSYGRLPPAFYTRLSPTPLPDPYLVAFNPDAADLIGLARAEAGRNEFAEIFCGNRLLPGFDPLAAIYAGHQFGGFVPQLGDGRTILLGEATGASGRWDLQLKGSGVTPYSRMGDGRAVLRSSIREYLASEAMHALGIPTTRALCIVGSDQPVIREDIETAAVLTRIAPSHVRFGSFELFSSRRQHDHVRTLADYVIDQHYPQLREAAQPFLELLREVIGRTARLIAQWQSVGFCHGVMNTDNMSILGITIDYGPYGFIEGFDWGHICNHTDHGGRYAYNMQPRIAHWNLYCLAESLLPLINMEEAEEALEAFGEQFELNYAALMRAKFGLASGHAEDTALMQDTLKLLHDSRADYTTFFRRLGNFDSASDADNAPLRDLVVERDAFAAWAARYRLRLALEAGTDAARKARMDQVNPKYVLRNHLAESAIRKAADQRDYSEIERLMRVLTRPFDEQAAMQAYAEPAAPGSAAPAVSCSS